MSGDDDRNRQALYGDQRLHVRFKEPSPKEMAMAMREDRRALLRKIGRDVLVAIHRAGRCLEPHAGKYAADTAAQLLDAIDAEVDEADE